MINLAVFKRIAAAVLVSGVLAGALLTAVQQVQGVENHFAGGSV